MSAKVINKEGDLPAHVVRNKGLCLNAIRLPHEAYPELIFVPDKKNKNESNSRAYRTVFNINNNLKFINYLVL